MEHPYSITADAIDPSIKYFNAASDPLIEPLLKATKTYNDNDCSSIDIYKTIKSLAEIITNIPNIENKNRTGYSKK